MYLIFQNKQTAFGASVSKSPVGGGTGALPISDSNVSTTNDSPAADNDWETAAEMNVSRQFISKVIFFSFSFSGADNLWRP